uniref:Uncharacterized protein n=1 Tax=Arundo donax TaxID=35708 RepID=A0A0A8Y0W3_ARUDO
MGTGKLFREDILFLFTTNYMYGLTRRTPYESSTNKSYSRFTLSKLHSQFRC